MATELPRDGDGVDDDPGGYTLLYIGSQASGRVSRAFPVESGCRPFRKQVWFDVLVAKLGRAAIWYGHAGCTVAH